MCQTKLKIQIFTHKRPLQSGDLYPRDRDDGIFPRRWKLALWEFCKNRNKYQYHRCPVAMEEILAGFQWV